MEAGASRRGRVSAPISTAVIEHLLHRLADEVADRVIARLRSPVAEVVAEQEYLTTEQAAQLAGLSRAAFDRRRARGTGPRYVKIGDRCIRYRRADVEAWLGAAR